MKFNILNYIFIGFSICEIQEEYHSAPRYYSNTNNLGIIADVQTTYATDIIQVTCKANHWQIWCVTTVKYWTWTWLERAWFKTINRVVTIAFSNVNGRRYGNIMHCFVDQPQQFIRCKISRPSARIAPFIDHWKSRLHLGKKLSQKQPADPFLRYYQNQTPTKVRKLCL